MNQDSVTLAIMMADVVGSTPLYERVGDAVALQQVLDCLDMICQISVQHGGEFMRSKGDDILTVFREPSSALNAAVQVGRQMSVWPLPIRVGLNHGPVVRARDDVFGDAVNVTARLTSSANPGETLVGHSMFEALPPSAQGMLRHLGRMEFKGKDGHFDVYTLRDNNLGLNTEIFSAKPARQEEASKRPEVAILIRHADRTVVLREGQSLSIGRSSDCDVVLCYPWVSRHHATVTVIHGRAKLMERSSSGTYLSVDFKEETFVRREDVILMGSGTISPGTKLFSDEAAALSYKVSVV